MDVFKTDLRRALSSWGFAVGIIGMAVAIFFGAFGQMLPVFQGLMKGGLPAGFSIQIVIDALHSDILFLILPVLCALPFTTAFVDDYKSHYLREYLPRAGKREYTFSRVMVTALSGGMTLFGGVLLTGLIFTLFFSPMEFAPIQAEQITELLEPEQIDISAQITFTDLVSRAFLFFLSGALWALVGGIFATMTMSKYMAYAAPFVFYYVLVIISDRYLSDIYVLNPQEWINPSDAWVNEMGGAALIVAELIIIMSIAYGYLIQRRLRDA